MHEPGLHRRAVSVDGATNGVGVRATAGRDWDGRRQRGAEAGARAVDYVYDKDLSAPAEGLIMIDFDDLISPLGEHLVSVITVPPSNEPLTLAQGKLRAGLDWPDGDPRDDLMNGFIRTARTKVETDGSLALLTQTRELYYDAVPIVLQLTVRPIQSAIVTAVLADGTEQIIDPATYTIDKAGGRIGFTTAPAGTLRSFQPWVIEVVAGWSTPTEIPPDLMQLVGLLTAHYATLGRDLASVESIEDVPYGYAELIEPWRLEILP